MRRAALCVGINQFASFPQATLQGCVNDAADTKSLLKDVFGLADGDITTLTDAQATKENILARLGALVDSARAGRLDYLFFSMSSHGTQVPDVSGDEPDRADEAFCPHDLAQRGGAWDPQHIILDDELYAVFLKLPANVVLEVSLDTCHSGTGLKGIDLLLDRKPRFLPPPSLASFREVEGRGSRGVRHFVRQQKELPHILWAACRSDQTSADARIGDSWHGAFTYFWCKEVRACRNQLSRAEVLKKVRADLTSHYSQVPQLEGPAASKRTPIAG